MLEGVSAPFSPVRASGEVGARTGTESGWLYGRSITDERAKYYHNTGLLRALQQSNPLPDHDWALEGRADRATAPAVVEKGSVGFYGYFAGPEVYVVDLLGLGNPLLARLQPADPDWRIGHFGRLMPEGYRETLETGENRIADPHLAVLRQAPALIIRGDLFDGRLRAILADQHRRRLRQRSGRLRLLPRRDVRQQFRVTNPRIFPTSHTYVWNNGAGETYLLDIPHPGRRTPWRHIREGVHSSPFIAKLSSIGYSPTPNGERKRPPAHA